MQPTGPSDYKQLLTDVIKKQIVILGPDITLSKARNVKGLTVANDGTVTAYVGSPQEVTQALIDQFVQLSGLIVKKTMEPLLLATQAPMQATPVVASISQSSVQDTVSQPVSVEAKQPKPVILGSETTPESGVTDPGQARMTENEITSSPIAPSATDGLAQPPSAAMPQITQSVPQPASPAIPQATLQEATPTPQPAIPAQQAVQSEVKQPAENPLAA